jgi:hypothetical protein
MWIVLTALVAVPTIVVGLNGLIEWWKLRGTLGLEFDLGNNFRSVMRIDQKFLQLTHGEQVAVSSRIAALQNWHGPQSKYFECNGIRTSLAASGF